MGSKEQEDRGTKQGQRDSSPGKGQKSDSTKQVGDWGMFGWCPGLPHKSMSPKSRESSLTLPAQSPGPPNVWDLATHLFPGAAQQDLGSGHVRCLHLDEPVPGRVVLGVSKALGVPRAGGVRLQAAV